MVQAGERRLDRLRGVRENMPAQAQQDVTRHAVQQPPNGARYAADPADRETDEDGGAGDGAEQGGGAVTHGSIGASPHASRAPGVARREWRGTCQTSV